MNRWSVVACAWLLWLVSACVPAAPPEAVAVAPVVDAGMAPPEGGPKDAGVAPTPLAPGDGRCHADADCGYGETCGGRGEGVGHGNRPPDPECGWSPTDRKCPRGQLCVQTTRDRWYGPACQKPCRRDRECKPGWKCDAGRCRVPSCLDGAVCGDWQDCDPVRRTGHDWIGDNGCVPRPCTDDEACRGGTCVHGRCRPGVVRCGPAPRAVPAAPGGG